MYRVDLGDEGGGCFIANLGMADVQCNTLNPDYIISEKGKYLWLLRFHLII